jgi:hypothetical protein
MSFANGPLPDIILEVPQASDAEHQRGIAAAWEVFKRRDAWPWDCVLAADEFDWTDRDPGLDLAAAASGDAETLAGLDLADIWHEAADAALHACCEGWPQLPDRQLVSFQLAGTPRFTFELRPPALFN